MFAQIYEGCKCGETWKVSRHTEVDCDNDEVFDVITCDICGKDIICEKKDEQGRPVLHPLSDEEIEELTAFNEFIDNEEYFDEEPF